MEEKVYKPEKELRKLKKKIDSGEEITLKDLSRKLLEYLHTQKAIPKQSYFRLLDIFNARKRTRAVEKEAQLIINNKIKPLMKGNF